MLSPIYSIMMLSSRKKGKKIRGGRLSALELILTRLAKKLMIITTI
jgi:hypothetical protein